MKKTLTKLLAIVLSVCLLLTTPVVTALAESNSCPIEEISLTLHRPMYENVDGYWDYSEEIGDFFRYDIYTYIANAATINLYYKDGTSKSFDYFEIDENNDFRYDMGFYGESQYWNPWHVGMEIEAYFDLCYTPSNETIFYDFTINLEETPIESIEAEATKNLVENASGNASGDLGENGEFESFYEYDVAYTEPTFTIKWKDSAKSDSVIAYNDIKNTLYVEPEFYTQQDYSNQWVTGGTYSATAILLGVECDFDVSVISSAVKSISVEATHNAIVDVDAFENYDVENEEYFYEYFLECFYPEITLTFENGFTLTETLDDFSIRTNHMYDIFASSNQSSKTPWTKAGNYSFNFELSLMDEGEDFENLKCTVPVTIVENPIKKITAVATEPVNVNNYDDYWDEEGSYKYYYNDGAPLITIYYADGTVSEPMYDSEVDDVFDNKYFCWVNNNQSYNNEWQLGKNKCTVEFLGHSADYDVYLTDRVVKSIKVLGAKIRSGNGYYDENDNFIYNTDFNIELEFTLWDDSVVTETVCGNDWCEYGYVEVISDQYTTPWTEGGENAFTVRLTDDFETVTTATGNVEITEYFEYSYHPTVDGLVIDGFWGKSVSGVLEIPESLDGEAVVAISSLSSRDGYDDYIQSVVIPDSVLSISDYALSDLTNLKSLEIGSGVLEIPESLLENCENLETLEVSANNSDYCSIQNAILTKDKTRLVAVAPACTETILLPAECTNIDVLYNYAQLYKNVKIGYETAGDYAVTQDGVTYTKDKKTVLFCDKEKTGAVVLLDTVTSFNQYAFSECDNITSVTIPNSVTNIAYGAFYGCDNLQSVGLPTQLKTIESSAFAECGSLASIELPNKLETIESWAFSYSGLKNITIPNSVEAIEYGAFSYSQIESAKLGSGVKYMSGAFSNAEELKTVNIPAGVEEFWGAFYECYSLNSVTLEEGLKLIDSSAFSCCTSLKSIKIPSTVTSIDNYAFDSSGLESITIPDSVTFLGEGAFAWCENLVTATIGSGIESLSQSVFAYTGLKTINWGKNIEKIENYAFEGSALESVEIPNTVTSIMYASFRDNNSLSSIKIPSSVQSVGAHTFDDTDWYMAQPNGNTYIDDVLYRYKGNATTPTVVNIKDGTRLIADVAFQNERFEGYAEAYDLSGITKINIPQSVKVIGNLAFTNLPNITEITLPDSLNNLGKFPFMYCENLSTVDIGKATADFDIYTFADAYNIENIIVDSQNTKYTSVDGVLYNKDMTRLIYCPPAKTGDLVVPVSVKEVDEFAFAYTNLSSVTFTNPNINLSYYAFDEYDAYYYLDEDYYKVNSYGMTETDVILKALENSYIQSYAQNHGFNFEPVAFVEEAQTGITVSETIENAIPEGAELVVESVEATEENTVVFDISLECDGETVQPEAPVTVKIPLPMGIDAQLCKVYRLEEDGSKTDMNAVVVNGYIYFTTEHFSLYVIESGFLPGDINGDGEVNLQDVVTLSQIVAEWEGIEHVEAALDTDGDGQVTLQDVVRLAQFVAEWDVTLSSTPYSE